jgi:predicted Zn-dependent protease
MNFRFTIFAALLSFLFVSCNELTETSSAEGDHTTGKERTLPANMKYSYDCIKDTSAVGGILGKADDLLGKVATFNIEVTDKEQVEFGEMFLKEAIKDKNFQIDSTDPVNAKLDKILQDLLRKRVKPTDITYKMYLVADTATINAYTVGGKIFITRAMLKKITNDDQLYAIIGHEIGHNEKGHIKTSIKQMKASNKYLGDWGDAFIVLKRIFTGSFNHKNELEADYFGLDLTWKLGYDVCAIRTFWDDMAKGESRSKIFDFLRTHPFSDTRSKCLVNHIERNFDVTCSN